MTVEELKSLLSRFNIHPDKRLGQNFLLSDKVLDEIVSAAELKNDDTVLEIGPGLGALTRQLGERAGQVLAVEKDRNICFALRKIFKNKKNVKIINDDALFLNFNVFREDGGEHVSTEFQGVDRNRLKQIETDGNLLKRDYKVVANIPYYITGKLLQNFLSPYNPPQPSLTLREGVPPLKVRGGEGELFTRPSLMVLLLQKEVAERITAKPGEMSILSVSVQFYSNPEIISYVSKDEFYPKPEVDSAVVRLRVLPKPRFNLDEHKFFHLVKVGFAGKRKQLQNNLRNLTKNFNVFREDGGEHVSTEFQGVDRNRLKQIETRRNCKDILSSLNLNPLARAQDLSLEDWFRLYQKIVDTAA